MEVDSRPSTHLSPLSITMRSLITGAFATTLSLVGLNPNGYLSACYQWPLLLVDRLKSSHMGHRTPSYSLRLDHSPSQRQPYQLTPQVTLLGE